MDSCIVHVSQTIERPLLAQSRRNNVRWGTTGVTLYVRGSFIQALEGSTRRCQISTSVSNIRSNTS
ncbi:BLUF domain-containing protein [Fibrella sp. USSR17]